MNTRKLLAYRVLLYLFGLRRSWRPSYPHSESLFSGDNTIVYFLFVSYLLFEILTSSCKSVLYEVES
jgi:hypothetical protein